MAGVLSTVLVAGGVFGVTEATKPKGVTPASINAAMAKFCGKRATAVAGFEATRRSISGWSEIKDFTPAAAATCTNASGVAVFAFFFRTSFDENNMANQLHEHASKWDEYGNYAVPAWSIGTGVIGTFRFPSKIHTQSVGQVANWMATTFGVLPVTRNFSNQDWTNTLPPITLESFGSPKPIVDKP